MKGRAVINTRKIVFPDDPALIEPLKPTVYKESNFDPEMVKIKDGERPTWLTIGRPTRRQKDHAYSLAGNEREFSNFMTRCVLLRVENYQIIRDDGSEAPLPEIVREDCGQMGTMCKESVLDDFDFPHDDLSWIAIAGAHMGEARPLSFRQSVRPLGDS